MIQHSKHYLSESTPGGRPGATTTPAAVKGRRRGTTCGHVVVAWTFSRGARKRFAEI